MVDDDAVVFDDDGDDNENAAFASSYLFRMEDDATVLTARLYISKATIKKANSSDTKLTLG
jgi:hypothetical protein